MGRAPSMKLILIGGDSHGIGFALGEFFVVPENFFEIPLDILFQSGNDDNIEFSSLLKVGFCVNHYYFEEFSRDFCG